jgi:hypothetical protein
MKLFNLIKSTALSLFLLAGTTAAFAQVPTFVQLPGTLPSSGGESTVFVDLNNDGRDDFVRFSLNGNLSVPVLIDSLYYAYGQIQIEVQLNLPNGTYGPTTKTLLPLIGQFNQVNSAANTNYPYSKATVAKLTPGSNNYGVILNGVATSQGVNLSDPNIRIDLNNIATLKGNGDGTFGAPVITSGIAGNANYSYRNYSFIPADLTGSGYQAQLLRSGGSAATGNVYSIFGLNGDGTYSTTPVSQIPPSSNVAYVSYLKFIDLNKDGKDDLIIRTTDNSNVESLSFYMGGGNNSAPTLTNYFTPPQSSPPSGTAFELGDFNGDGFPDFLKITGYTYYNYNGVDPFSATVYSIFLNDGTGKPMPTPTTTHTNTCVVIGQVGPGGGTSYIPSCTDTGDSFIVNSLRGGTQRLIADLDGDGYDDIIGYDSLGYRVFSKSNGDGTFQAPQIITPIPYGSFLKIGSNGTTSFYSSDSLGNYVLMQNTLNISVASTTTLSINPIAPLFGQSTTFTATVTGKQPGGVVNFADGTTSLGSAPLVNGKATLTLPAGLSGGAHTITASFPSDFRNRASSASSSITVVGSKVVTQSNLTTLAEVVAANVPVVLTTKVTGNNPTGTVVFVGEDGKEIGRATLVNGTASLSIVLPKGKYEIKAKYLGDAANLASSSNQIEVKVKKFNERGAKLFDDNSSSSSRASDLGLSVKKFYAGWTSYLGRVFGLFAR